MASQDKKVEVRFGAFACSIEGYDDPVGKLGDILNLMQKMIAETPALAESRSGFDPEPIADALNEDADSGSIPNVVVIRNEVSTASAKTQASDAELDEAIDHDIPEQTETAESAPSIKATSSTHGDTDRVPSLADRARPLRAVDISNDLADADVNAPHVHPQTVSAPISEPVHSALPATAHFIPGPDADMREADPHDRDPHEDASYRTQAEDAGADQESTFPGTSPMDRDDRPDVPADAADIVRAEVRAPAPPQPFHARTAIPDTSAIINIFAPPPPTVAARPGPAAEYEDRLTPTAFEEAVPEQTLMPPAPAPSPDPTISAEEPESAPAQEGFDPGRLFQGWEQPAIEPAVQPTGHAESRFDTLLRRVHGQPAMGAPGEAAEPPAPLPPSDNDLDAPAHDFPLAGELAERAGDRSISGLLCASAAWLSLVMRKPRFTRREVMEVLQSIPSDQPYEFADRIKGFGKLVRSGSLILVDDGAFALAQHDRERFEALMLQR